MCAVSNRFVMKDESIEIEETAAEHADETHVSELMSPVWSVIGFDRCFASGLSYDEAVAEISERAAEEHAGLCIVTDEAARRMRKH